MNDRVSASRKKDSVTYRLVDYGKILALYPSNVNPATAKPFATGRLEARTWVIRYNGRYLKVPSKKHASELLNDVEKLVHAFRGVDQGELGAFNLPAPFVEQLRRMKDDHDLRFAATLSTACNAGWAMPALARALGEPVQNVEKWVRAGAGKVTNVPVPEPGGDAAKDAAWLIHPEEAKRLRRMHDVAATVNGATPVDDHRRRVSEQLSAKLAAYVDQGVPVNYLAEVLDVTPRTITFRLGRHGYMPLPPSLMKDRYRNRQTWPGDVDAPS